MNADAFFVLGATHHKAPISVRERLSLSPAAAETLAGSLRQLEGLQEFTILSTCNRLEFYGVASHPEAAARVQAAFCAVQNFDPAEFDRCRLDLRGPAALRHLLDVSAGLDSQLLGENEIFGQVKDAYAAAQAKGHTGAVLNRVFQKAFQAAKHVRTHTAIAAGQVSIYSVAVELAHSVFGDLASTRILLLGAGDIGEKTARAFQSRGATSMTVASRRLERAMELATTLNSSALPFEQREARLAEFDIVVCATSAPGTVVARDAVRTALHKRPARPILFLDLAMPRDVEAGVAELQNVFLYNLDDLAIIAEENRVARESELAKCRAILGEKVDALWKSIESRLPAVPAMSAAAERRDLSSPASAPLPAERGAVPSPHH